MSVKEGLLEHEHIALNTTIYYVTKQQIDNWKFIPEPTTIVLYKLLCKPWKQYSVDRFIYSCSETPINSTKTYSLLINLTRSPREKDSRGDPHYLRNCLLLEHSPPPFPPEFPLPFVGRGGKVWIFSGNTQSDLIFTTRFNSHLSLVSIRCIFTEIDHPLHFFLSFFLTHFRWLSP